MPIEIMPTTICSYEPPTYEFQMKKRNPASEAAHGKHQTERNPNDHRGDESAHDAEEAHVPALPIAFLAEHLNPGCEHGRRSGNGADPRQIVLLESQHAENVLERRKELRRHPLLGARADFPQ